MLSKTDGKSMPKGCMGKELREKDRSVTRVEGKYRRKKGGRRRGLRSLLAAYNTNP